MLRRLRSDSALVAALAHGGEPCQAVQYGTRHGVAVDDAFDAIADEGAREILHWQHTTFSQANRLLTATSSELDSQETARSDLSEPTTTISN